MIQRLIQIWRNQWPCSLFFVFDQKCPFWVNLVQIVTIVSLRWNLIPRLIWIRRIQWCCFRPEMLFLGQIWSKLSVLSVECETWSQWLCLLFTFFDRKCPFWTNLVQNVKMVSLSLNFIASVIRICRIQWCCSLFLLSTLFGQCWSKMSKLLV